MDIYNEDDTFRARIEHHLPDFWGHICTEGTNARQSFMDEGKGSVDINNEGTMALRARTVRHLPDFLY